MKQSTSKTRLVRRHTRVRGKISGTSERPRLAISRSNISVQAQIIDDTKHVTLLGMSDRVLKTKGTKQEKASLLGKEIAKAAKSKGISKVVFDRGGFQYHGRIKAFADGAREGGLEF